MKLSKKLDILTNVIVFNSKSMKQDEMKLEKGRILIDDKCTSFVASDSDVQIIVNTKSLLEGLRKAGLTDYYKEK